MDKSNEQIYKEFAAQLCQWGESGTPPAAGNQDISYGLEQQRKRLEKNGIRIDYRLNKRKKELNPISAAVFSDTRYTNALLWKAYQRELSYIKDGRKCLGTKDNAMLYTIVTRLNHSDIQAAYCCPNCGAVSDVSTLLEGCPYCHTRFVMSDLFPKVTNYYFLPDYNLGEKESKDKTVRWMMCGGAIGFLLRFPDLITNVAQGKSPILMLLGTLMIAGVSAVFGYFALSISLLVKLLSDGVKQIPRVPGQLGAKKKLTELLKQFDSGFTYEYFIGKVQALLKILIFTDDWTQLSIYEGTAGARDLAGIIDAQFEGTIGLNGYRVEGDYCHLDLNVYMTDVYCQGNRLQRRSDVFRIGLCRNISRPEDYGFSIKQVSCKSCGASFDATRERFCPYCRSSYDLKEDDWVITSIQ